MSENRIKAAFTHLKEIRKPLIDEAVVILDRHRNQKDYNLPTAITDTKAKEWAVYLQALRDLPNTVIKPKDLKGLWLDKWLSKVDLPRKP